ncbi:MAG: EamA/RhaT family transporter [Moraxella sp.]|nr:EamA/RhaT family transporter [Moraxella sp.]
MSFLIFAIIASVCVSIFLKMVRGYQWDIAQAILVNYTTALCLCFWLLKPDFSKGVMTTGQGLGIVMALGLLLPSVFIIMAKAVQIAGIVKSDAAQRLALFLPILAAFVLFGEMITLPKVLGVLLAFVALICLVYKPSDDNEDNITENDITQIKNINNNQRVLLFNHVKLNQELSQTHASALILLGVWLGYGVIDILFKQMSKQGNAFSGTLFISFGLAWCVMLIYLLINKTKWHGKSLISGILLGVLNFFNILFYIKAHQSFKDDPTLVFAGMNIGVISLGAVVGLIIFKEKLTKINLIGIVIGMIAIGCLFYLDKLLIM